MERETTSCNTPSLRGRVSPAGACIAAAQDTRLERYRFASGKPCPPSGHVGDNKLGGPEPTTDGWGARTGCGRGHPVHSPAGERNRWQVSLGLDIFRAAFIANPRGRLK